MVCVQPRPAVGTLGSQAASLEKEDQPVQAACVPAHAHAHAHAVSAYVPRGGGMKGCWRGEVPLSHSHRKLEAGNPGSAHPQCSLHRPTRPDLCSGLGSWSRLPAACSSSSPRVFKFQLLASFLGTESFRSQQMLCLQPVIAYLFIF